MHLKTILLSGAILVSCQQSKSGRHGVQLPLISAGTDNPFPFIAAVPAPEGFSRKLLPANSYGQWLRNLPLKKDKTVYLFDGRKKDNQEAQFAVLDISVGPKDLQQCADAVMRMRAEYFYNQRAFEKILFYDNEGHAYPFEPPFNREHFIRYLDRVFGMCGSASLSKQLNKVKDFNEIMPGDVLIRGGFPGHAATVMDVAEGADGKKLYLLSQSYMPAQDIHLLVNPSDAGISPWYAVSDEAIIETPEYRFRKDELMRW